MSDKLHKNMSMENIATAVLFIILFLYPAFPGVKNYGLLQFTGYFYQLVLACSVVLIWGFTGIFTFAQVAFFGLAGYCYAVVVLNMERPSLTWLATLIAIGFAFLVALVFGYFMFYGGVNESFIGIITLCLTMLCQTFFSQTADTTKYRIGKAAFNGANGITGLPGLVINGEKISIRAQYFIVLIILCLIVCSLIYIKKQRIGYALIAIRENPSRASLLGYNNAYIKTMTFAVGGAIAGLAGVLYIWWGGYIVPTAMSMTSATIPIVICAAGGRKSPISSMLFGLGYLMFDNYLAYKGSQFSLIILGVVLILVIMLIPNGIVETVLEALDRKIFKPEQVKTAAASTKGDIS